MAIKSWFRRTREEISDDVEDVFDGVKANIELVMGVLGSVLVSALFTVLQMQVVVEVTKWTILTIILELIATPFVMLFIFKIVSEKRDKRVKAIRKGHRTCIVALRKSDNDKTDLINKQKLDSANCNSKHELDMAQLRYEKDMEIERMKVHLQTKNSKIELLETELNISCS